ncbi:alpha-amylase family glycosyl hydrolase [Clostridium sp. SHJSY1]|uniref:pullulanase X25 domain-containing protein n=1 Tax=Clostridium sp. SHJSY1 TaxID=2942483 RepID=UPI0028756164|nr:alpha-amylase family glycosyl hydrolase [Clostridium sp. SHJSY1]MDS0524072.1 alpha-amylase family glycosyl hydrolase [Clostridium sp. SHJSY1]
MRKNNFRRITWFTLVMFLFTLFNNLSLSKVRAVESSVKADSVAVLVGNLMKDNNLGEDWNPKNYFGKLKEYKNGVYEATLKLKANEKYEYKIAMNGAWDESYGKDGGQDNVLLNLKEDKDITFRLDYKNKKVYDSVNNPDQFKSKAILTGELDKCLGGKSWDPSDDDFKLDYVGGGIYKKTFKVTKSGTMEFKIAYNGAWNNGEAAANQKIVIPEGTESVTFFSDCIGNVTENSVDNPEILKNVSLIGTVRSGDGDWDVTSKSFDMHQIDSSKFLYTSILKAGNYEYKGIVNYSFDDGGIPKTDNVSLKLDSEKNVVFIVDIKEGKIIDSINNPDEVALAVGLKSQIVEVKSPVVNDNGTITFNYKNAEAKKVSLTSNINEWSKDNTALTRSDDGVWSTTIRVGDDAKEIQYKFIVDGKEILDPSNKDVNDGKSVVNFPKYEGRNVTIPGSLSTGIEGTDGTWNPADKALKLDYIGNGNYKKTFKGVKGGRYEYKIALNYTWDPENYGANGVDHGSNISIIIPQTMDLTFLYNDDSHKVVTDLDYKVLNITLNDGNKVLGKLTDEKLNGVYSGKVDLKKGSYDNLNLTVKGEEERNVKVDKLILDRDRTVTFSYDPKTEICFNDASDEKVDNDSIYYNSRIEEYKSPYGAVSVGTPIKFSLKVKKDIGKEGKMILSTPKGIKVIDMNKNGNFDDGNDRWTSTYTPETIGTFSYYFVISNGSDVKAYGDDDGYFAEGKVGNLGEVKNYEFNVSTKDFKTPDWLKNGVIYQIYPDRFFNGDKDNDYMQKYARGTTPYEFISDWYSLPKDPDLMLKDGYVYPSNANKGDVNAWSNDLYGGDLKGIEEKINYLKSVGVTVLYLNPVGQSISSHRYDTTDYTKLDAQLGKMEDFINLAKVAKENGMHIILDGVYNHVSDDSVYFDRYGKYVAKGRPLGAYQYWSHVYDEINNSGLSQVDAEKKVTDYYNSIGITDLHYKDWFIVNNAKTAEKDSKGNETGKYYYSYEGWSGYDSMPVIQALNGSEYNVKSWRNEVIDGDNSVARQWLRDGSNGWRLDVANEISDETWRAFRKTVKEEGDNAIIGEIWTDASSYIIGDMYDSVMNYRFRGAMLNFVKGTQDDNKTRVTAKDSMNELEKMREQYPREALEAMMNLVGSHDTQRVLSALDGAQKSTRGFANPATDLAKAKMRLIPFLQMTYIGAPTIYYGDEIGMVGCDDPDNRRAFTWGKGDKELVEWYAKLAAIRNGYSSLRTGEVSVPQMPKEFENDVMAYLRSDDDSKALVVANREEKEVETTFTVPGVKEGTTLTNILNDKEIYKVEDGKVTVRVPALGGVILVDKVKEINFNKDGLKDAYNTDSVVKNRIIPETDKEIEDKISKAENGSEVVISNMNEGISGNLLEYIVNSGKDLKIVIKRGNIKITIKDVKKLKETLSDQGLTDFKVLVNDNLDNEVKNLNLIDKFNIKTNLKDGALGTDMMLEVSVDKNNDGKELYCYYIAGSDNFVLAGKGEVQNGIFTFVTNHFSDYIIVDNEITNKDPENKDKDKKLTSANNDDEDSNGEKSATAKTGDMASENEFILLISMLFVAFAGFRYSYKKKKA